MTETQASGVHLEQYWSIVKRRRWWILGPLFAGWLVVWIVGWLIPAKYRSQSTILIQQQSVPKEYVVPNVTMDPQERLHAMTQQVLSRTRLEQLIVDLNLYPNQRGRLGPDGLVKRMRKDIHFALAQIPGQKAASNSNDLTAFTIGYDAPNPGLAQQVANRLTSLFINENLKDSQQASESTTAFFESQLSQAKQALDEKEKQLTAFKAQYLGQLPDQMEGNVQILGGLQSRMSSDLDDLNRARQQNTYLTSLLNQYTLAQTHVSDNTGDQSLDAINQQLSDLRMKETDLLSRYTSQYPDVQRVKQEIRETEAKKKQILASLAKKPAKPVSNNQTPTSYQALQAMAPMMQVRSQLRANRQEITSREADLKQVEAQIQTMEGRLNVTPIRQQQLSDLNQQYQQAQNYYDSLLAKKDQSALASDLQMREEGDQFRVLDPPNLPVKPYSPNRNMFGWLGVLAGVVIALGFVVVKEITDERVWREADLAGLVPVANLGSIPVLATAADLTRAERLRKLEFMVASAMLVIIALGNFIAYRWG